MKAYLRDIVNKKRNNLAKLLFTAKFAYNNAKNASTGYMLFEFNCGYHCYVFFEDKIDLYLRFCSVNKLTKMRRELISICYQDLLNAQKL